MKARARGDFSADRRLLRLSAISLVVGVVGAALAALLLAVLVPVAGGLVVGLMARYGSEAIRGHGIPEALEAILYGRSVLSPRVAVLKPLSSAVSIGSGGPFGAEGPIIMTGGRSARSSPGASASPPPSGWPPPGSAGSRFSRTTGGGPSSAS